MKIKVSCLLILVICNFFFMKVFAQNLNTDKIENKNYIYTIPQYLIFGANIGTDFSISSKITLGGEINAHYRFGPPNLAISPIMKYYFKGQIGNGYYARAKLVGGFFFNQTAIDDHPYYAGGGIGIGGMTPLFRSGKWYIFADLGFKFVAPFGNRSQSKIDDNLWGMIYYTLLSPASMPELFVGIAFRL
ncbi:hypothetical protein [Porphyromonas pogonae]|uniref:hypothetical protein n=1 Tax=Porphyromonas pogonae TaxID=867595 RepID=UPI002E7782FF|nr:hypothetical protein [Porphyromonas pogonae]